MILQNQFSVFKIIWIKKKERSGRLSAYKPKTDKESFRFKNQVGHNLVPLYWTLRQHLWSPVGPPGEIKLNIMGYCQNEGCSKSFALLPCTHVVVTLQQHARAHIFCKGLLSVYTKFGEEQFIIPCRVNKKTLAMVPVSEPKSDMFGFTQFLTLKNVPGHEIRRRSCAVRHNSSCAVYKSPNICNEINSQL